FLMEIVSCCPSQAGSTSRSPDAAFPENPSGSYMPHTHPSSCFIPNRIFVGGFNFKVNKDDLRHIFSQHGAVKDVKIVLDHSGMSRG
uniref:RRM domain-containing protein n=1 Tax=Myripristis murdjan TaxID=586833 RepID=A0A667X6V1_9TELE